MIFFTEQEEGLTQHSRKWELVVKNNIVNCIFCSGITLILMLGIWGSKISMLFNPLSDYKNFGHPMILFDPKLSFIGWLVLMIIISPFLQLIASIFSAFITLKVRLKSFKR